MSLNNYLSLSIDERFEQFMSSLSISNRTPQYYVNWDKVIRNTKEFELELNTLNFLLGKDNIEEEAYKLFLKQPQLLKAIPSLIASRDSVLDILMIDQLDMKFSQINFKDIDTNNISLYIDFMKESGVLDFIKNNLTSNLVDYVYGVEAGLDTNARKSRSGYMMENILSLYVADITSEDRGIVSLSQAGGVSIEKISNIQIPVDRSIRRYDEVIYDKKEDHLYLIETNYYGGGGSKLKAVAGEFSELNMFLSSMRDKITFIWVTDGQGWKTSKSPLLEAFYKVDYIFNLKMVEEGYLKDLIWKQN